jgi:hypothetical protein
MLQAHRVSYTFFRGEIPPGLDVDHQCFNRSCINPSHLIASEAITNRKRQRKALANRAPA